MQLRPVDDESSDSKPVVRLRNSETAAAGLDQKPVRLSLHQDEARPDPVRHRLEMPSQDEPELRTHQPGIEALIEQESVEGDGMEQKWGESSRLRNPIPWGWFLLIGLLLLGAVFWSLSGTRKGAGQAVGIQGKIESAIENEEMEIVEATRLIERIESQLRRFFECTSVDSLIRMVRHPDRVGPMIRAYHADKPVGGALLRKVRVLQPLTLGGRGDFWMVSLTLTDNREHDLILEVGPSGEPLIDWETFVCYQPVPWDDFVQRRPSGESFDFRVYVEEDHFYSHEFADADRWACFRLTARGSEEPLYGYMASDSPDLPKLRTMVQSNRGKRVSVILRLLIPENLQSHRGVVIEKFLSPRWIYVDPPVDDP